jgi:protein TonB
MARGGRLALTVSIVLHLAVVAALWCGPATAVWEAPPVFEVILTPSPALRPDRPRPAEARTAAATPVGAAPRAAPSTAVASAGASTAPAPLSEPPPVAGTEAAPPVTAGVMAPARPGVDPFDAWSRQVWAAIDRHRPRGEAGAGTARVAFTLDTEGRLTALRLAASSGSPAFDREATRAVRAAAPFPPPPTGVDPHRLGFEVLVRSSGG